MLSAHLYSNTNIYYKDKWAKNVKFQRNSFSDIRDHEQKNAVNLFFRLQSVKFQII
jgi:hypothetical protein